MLSYVFRQIIKQNRKEFEDDHKKRQEVIEARKAGLTIAQIAAQTGVGRTTVKA